jgi:Protein of unknown function (DUF2924)
MTTQKRVTVRCETCNKRSQRTTKLIADGPQAGSLDAEAITSKPCTCGGAVRIAEKAAVQPVQVDAVPVEPTVSEVVTVEVNETVSVPEVSEQETEMKVSEFEIVEAATKEELLSKVEELLTDGEADGIEDQPAETASEQQKELDNLEASLASEEPDGGGDISVRLTASTPQTDALEEAAQEATLAAQEEPMEPAEPEPQPSRAAVKVKSKPVKVVAKGRDPRLPAIGTILSRDFKGRTIAVELTQDGGYLYNGTRYTSLSSAATAATGISTNGFLFFGLNKK